MPTEEEARNALDLLVNIDDVKRRYPSVPFGWANGTALTIPGSTASKAVRLREEQVMADLGYLLGEVARLENLVEEGPLQRIRILERRLRAMHDRATTAEKRAKNAELVSARITDSLLEWRTTP